MKPGLHREFWINELVWFDLGDGSIRHGRITGIATQGIIFTYIITLDEPLDAPESNAPWETVCLPGGMLKSKMDSMK